MKKFTVFVLLLSALAITASLTGCNSCSNDWKHITSSTVGIERTITTYEPNKAPRSITTKGKIDEDKGSSIYFVDDNNKSHYWPSTYTWVDEN
jgi:uncharacterized lipoprotein YehR (DUF1307 family)